MASNDPDFDSKAADVIGLYLNPPQHAAVFSLDEKTQVQALDRLDPVLPLSPGRDEVGPDDGAAIRVAPHRVAPYSRRCWQTQERPPPVMARDGHGDRDSRQPPEVP